MPRIQTYVDALRRSRGTRITLVSDETPLLTAPDGERRLPGPVPHQDVTGMVEEIIPPELFSDIVMGEPVSFPYETEAGRVTVSAEPGASRWRVTVAVTGDGLIPLPELETPDPEPDPAPRSSADRWSELEMMSGPVERISAAGLSPTGDRPAPMVLQDLGPPPAAPPTEGGFVLRGRPVSGSGPTLAAVSFTERVTPVTGSPSPLRPPEPAPRELGSNEEEVILPRSLDDAPRVRVELSAVSRSPSSPGLSAPLRPDSISRSGLAAVAQRIAAPTPPPAPAVPATREIAVVLPPDEVPVHVLAAVDALLEAAWSAQAEDVVLVAGRPPVALVCGRVTSLPFDADATRAALSALRDVVPSPAQGDALDREGLVALCFRSGRGLTVVRLTLLRHEGQDAAFLRRVGEEHRAGARATWLPEDVARQVARPGLHLIAGPPGGGKTTVAAALAGVAAAHLAPALVIARPLERRLADDVCAVHLEVGAGAESLRNARRTPARLILVDLAGENLPVAEALALAAEGRCVVATVPARDGPCALQQALAALGEGGARRLGACLVTVVTTTRSLAPDGRPGLVVEVRNCEGTISTN
jgi:hypothetical protein